MPVDVCQLACPKPPVLGRQVVASVFKQLVCTCVTDCTHACSCFVTRCGGAIAVAAFLVVGVVDEHGRCTAGRVAYLCRLQPCMNATHVAISRVVCVSSK